MRILYTAVDTPIPGADGGGVHALELCRALARRGHDVHLAAPASGPWPQGEETLRLEPVPRPPRFLEWTAVRRLRSLARRLRPDVIVERFYTFGGAGIWAAHGLGIPGVLEVNSPARPYPGSWRDRLDRLSLVRPIDRWRRAILRWSSAIYATSHHLVPPELQSAVTVVTNGVDTDRFRPGPSRGGRLRCVYASSFRSWHGAEALVEAVAACVASGADLEVVCLGDGPRLPAARAAAERLGVGDVIRFTGRIPYDDVPGHLASADVGLAPFEPGAFTALQLGWFWSPIKIFEYLAAGLGVVTIGIDELRRLLPDGVGWFYPAGQTDALAARLRELASDPARARAVRPAARALAEARYGWSRQAEVVDGVLRAAVEARSVS